MSEEQHNEETEVEAHTTGGRVSDVHKFSANEEADDGDEVEGHVMKVSRPKHS